MIVHKIKIIDVPDDFYDKPPSGGFANAVWFDETLTRARLLDLIALGRVPAQIMATDKRTDTYTVRVIDDPGMPVPHPFVVTGLQLAHANIRVR